jgi:hypothetical protein
LRQQPGCLLDGRIDRGQGELGTTALIEAFRPAA